MSPAATAAVGAATMGPALRSRAPPPTRAHCTSMRSSAGTDLPLLPRVVRGSPGHQTLAELRKFARRQQGCQGERYGGWQPPIAEILGPCEKTLPVEGSGSRTSGQVMVPPWSCCTGGQAITPTSATSSRFCRRQRMSWCPICAASASPTSMRAGLELVKAAGQRRHLTFARIHARGRNGHDDGPIPSGRVELARCKRVR
jgi:hypothetical protein